MKKAFRTMLAVLLVLAMVFPMTACFAEGTAPEKITFTFGVRSSSLGTGINPDLFPQLRYIADHLGVELDVVSYDDEKFKLMATTGDLPDIFHYGSVSDVEGFLSSGNVLELSEILDQYGPDIKANYPDALSRVNNENGGYWAIPVAVYYGSDYPSSDLYVGMRARYDIYKEAGSPKIETQDDYLAALKQMQDYQREKTGEDDIYAFSAWTDWGMWPWIIGYPFSMGYGNGGIATTELNTSIMHYGYGDDGIMWKCFSFFNKAYRMGLFDPDGFVQKFDQYAAKIKSGKTLSSIEFENPNQDLTGELAVMAVLPGTAFPFINGIYGQYSPYGYILTDSLMISSKCPDPARAIQFLNWCNSAEGRRVLANGIPGVDWDVIDGVPQLIGDALAAYENNTISDYRKDRNLTEDLYNQLTSGKGLFDDGYPVYLHDTLEAKMNRASEAAKNYAQDFGDFAYKGQVYEKWYQDGIVDTNIGEGYMRTMGAEAYTPPWTDAENSIYAEVENYMMTKIPEIIMADSDDAFESVKQDAQAALKDIGAEDCFNARLEKWQNALAEYDAVNDK